MKRLNHSAPLLLSAVALALSACADDAPRADGSGGASSAGSSGGGSPGAPGGASTVAGTAAGGEASTGGWTAGRAGTTGGTGAMSGVGTGVGGAEPRGGGGGTSSAGGGAGTGTGAGALKPRVVVLTDISTYERDDHESLTRILAHADVYEIEGLVLSNGWSLPRTTNPAFMVLIEDTVDAYEKDLPNLMKRSAQAAARADENIQEVGYWPSAAYLRERTMFGSMVAGKDALGADNDSDGSKLIIRLADEANDARPIWVLAWGAGNTLSQAIWRVKNERTPEQLRAFLRKVRIYTITDQDNKGAGGSSHAWMREVAGEDLLFVWDECAWGRHNGTGKSKWSDYQTHIQGHGALGGQYPKFTVGVEGDTPSFLYLTPTGLNDPDDPSQSTWGGTYQSSGNNLWQSAGSCGKYFDRFYGAAFANFAARMDWAANGAGNRNPVIVLDGDDGHQVLTRTAKPGTALTLDASATHDPDGDNLKFNWWVQADIGAGSIDISGADTRVATVNVPVGSAGKSYHVLCEVTDDGTHQLSDYRRIVVKPSN